MKTLKFAPELCEQIIARIKTSTWRLFDDKDLTVGDEINFVNKATLESFGTGEITQLYTKTLGTLEESDWIGHERFDSEEAMYSTYKTFYGDRVTPETEVKIIHFTFSENMV
jgi:hypothetical protein